MPRRLIPWLTLPVSALVTFLIYLFRALALDTKLTFSPWAIPICLAIFAALTVVSLLVFARDEGDGDEFVCTCCGAKFKPGATAGAFAIRLFSDDVYLKCPSCGERTPCRRKRE